MASEIRDGPVWLNTDPYPHRVTYKTEEEVASLRVRVPDYLFDASFSWIRGPKDSYYRRAQLDAYNHVLDVLLSRDLLTAVIMGEMSVAKRAGPEVLARERKQLEVELNHLDRRVKACEQLLAAVEFIETDNREVGTIGVPETPSPTSVLYDLIAARANGRAWTTTSGIYANARSLFGC